MRGDVDDIRFGMLARVTSAFADELDASDPVAAVPWPQWPDVAALADHLGGNHLWAAAIVRDGERVDRTTIPTAPASGLGDWYRACRDELLATLVEASPDRACWTIGASAGVPAFWTRRMLYETTKHLIDLRAASGGDWRAAAELAPVDYADGIDELFAVFLPRSAPGLAPLPAPVVLSASDADRSWHLAPTWAVSSPAPADPDAVVLTARTADLALAVWERADPLDDSGRYRIDGDPTAITALRAAPIHPG